MQIKNVLIPIICLILCTACHQTESNVQVSEVQTFQITDDMVTELCICHAVNPDGSVLLWGDRTEDDLFYAYSVPDTTGKLQFGDEIAIRYSENDRLHAVSRDEKSDKLFFLKTGQYELLSITPAVTKMAVNGSRCQKYLSLYKIENETQAQAINDTSTLNTNTDIADNAVTTATTAEQIEIQADADVQNIIMDNSALDNTGGQYQLSVKTASNKLTLRVNDTSFQLSDRYTYCFAETIYAVDQDTYMGSTHITPEADQMLIYLNQSSQLQAGLITYVETTPNNMYLITFTPVSITSLR